MRRLLISGDSAIASCLVAADGTVKPLRQASYERATYCALCPDGVFSLYEGNASSAFLRLGRELELLDRVEIRGGQLCHLFYSDATHTLYGSSYGSGYVTAIGTERGVFSGVKSSVPVGEGRPGTPRAHCAVLSPDSRFLLVAAIDQDCIYSFQTAGDGSISTELEPMCAGLPGGSGPRHLKFHPDGAVVYAVTEYSNEIFVLSYTAETGKLQLQQTVPILPAGFSAESFGSSLVISSDGRRLYAANRGADTVALLQIAEDHSLAPIAQYPCGGHWPRHMEWFWDEKMLAVANQRSNSVTLHQVEPTTGALTVAAQIPFDRPGFAIEWPEN